MVLISDYLYSIKERIKLNPLFRSVYPVVRFGIHIILYAITAPFTNLISLFKTFRACRVLSFKNRDDLAGFNMLGASVWPYYYRYSLELSRFGRKRKSPNISLGDYPMKNFFYYTESVPLFRFANNHLVIISIFGWWLSFFLWIPQAGLEWVSIVMGIVLISATFMALLARMNYNIMGFLFLPLALFGLYTENWWLVSLGWLGVSFGSITLLLMGGLLTLVAVFKLNSIYPLIAFVPACIKLLPNFITLYSGSKLGDIINDTAKFIGLSKGKSVRYKWPSAKEAFFVFDKLYYFLALLQFILVHYFITANIDFYLLTGLFIVLINSSFARFSDDQNIWIFVVSLAMVTMIYSYDSNYVIWLVISFWLLVSPFPTVLTLGRRFIKGLIPYYGHLAPINIKPIYNKFSEFLSPVKPDQKVFMAFNDPGDKYGNVFDGLRFHIEFPLYIASQKNVLLFPDWMAVVQNNYIGAPDFWGREPVEVEINIRKWNADYAMIYQSGITELDPKWSNTGYEVVSHCTWEANEFKGKDTVWFPYLDLSWWLVRKEL